MPKYSYKAKNGTGQDVGGVVEADSQNIAVSLLKDRGYIVYSLRPYKKELTVESLLSFRGVSDTDKVNFTQSLASMTKAGLPLASALEILTDQSKNPKMREVVQTALTDVEAGMPLSQSLAKYPDVFQENIVSLIQAGEASGKIAEVLERLSYTLEKRREFTAKVKGAMIYPVIIMIAMSAVFLVIVVFVIPKLVDMYSSFGVELPWATKAMIWFSNFIKTKWYLVLAIIAGSVYGFKTYAKTTSGAHNLGRMTLKIPVFGSIMIKRDLTEFTRSLSLLVSSGVAIIDALSISRDSVGNILFKEDISRFVDAVKSGGSLSDAIKKSSNFPPIVSKLIRVGEETGTTDDSLTNISNYYEKEVDTLVKNLSTALEPMIMVVLGVMVGGLIVSVITPIYKLMSQF
ncbi:type II secretion system F family protein [bacterium]|nr:type II secretion system F family protein [bacterium]